MKIKGTPAELEARRPRAAELLGQGKGANEVARPVGVSSSSVSRSLTRQRCRPNLLAAAFDHAGLHV
jgi:transposase